MPSPLGSLLAPLAPSLFVLLSFAPLDQVAEQVAAFAKAVQATPKQPKPIDDRKAAIALLDGADAPQVAQALVEAYADVADEVVADEASKAEVDAKLEVIVQGPEYRSRKFTVESKKVFDQLTAETAAYAKQIEALHELGNALLERTQQLDRDETVGWLVSNAMGAKKLPLTLKLAVARKAGERPDVMAVPLMKALGRATTAEELAVTLEGLARCGKDARDCAPTVVRALKHDDAAVREQAAWALAHLGAPEGIAPLVAQMALEGGRTLRRFGVALEILTGAKLGDSARAWQEWLEREGADFVAGRKPLGKGRSTLAEALSGGSKPGEDVYYYGIPQEGHSIVYVIDCSGSMRVSIKAPRGGGGGGGGGGPPEDAGPDSRMEATKDALIEVLGKLTKEDKFNVVCFNDVVLPWQKSMTIATPKTVQQAQAWVRELQANGTTNIHDAMQEAFRLAGRGAEDKYYKCAVDTIFLLTDGSPTRADNQPDSTERILEAVRRWNPVKHVVIHTIGIGKELNSGFLQQIAKENGGRFVQQ